ncbi:hypothetical protein DOTSEDRAFT_39214 [Dothistroma septosporum NZE10]|uniref:Uncharacterized protein n=1 Tax=Dothistroma septosporum (strain NZE10 / CBS 128990) TaxID=675120 RepID=M2XHV1_DOTSN|nr:hypothetical protein DOTSEDRAFT_39214 [Dothistroma septosporum NZE10]
MSTTDRKLQVHTRLSHSAACVLRLAGLQEDKSQDVYFRTIRPAKVSPEADLNRDSLMHSTPILRHVSGRLIKYDLAGAIQRIWCVHGRPMDIFWSKIEACALDDLTLNTIDIIAGLAVQSEFLAGYLLYVRILRWTYRLGREGDRIMGFNAPYFDWV